MSTNGHERRDGMLDVVDFPRAPAIADALLLRASRAVTKLGSVFAWCAVQTFGVARVLLDASKARAGGVDADALMTERSFAPRETQRLA